MNRLVTAFLVLLFASIQLNHFHYDADNYDCPTGSLHLHAKDWNSSQAEPCNFCQTGRFSFSPSNHYLADHRLIQVSTLLYDINTFEPFHFASSILPRAPPQIG